MRIIEKIEISNNGFTVYHDYKNEKAIKKLVDYYVSTLKSNGHDYKAKYSTSLITLKHVCCKD